MQKFFYFDAKRRNTFSQWTNENPVIEKQFMFRTNKRQFVEVAAKIHALRLAPLGSYSRLKWQTPNMQATEEWWYIYTYNKWLQVNSTNIKIQQMSYFFVRMASKLMNCLMFIYSKSLTCTYNCCYKVSYFLSLCIYLCCYIQVLHKNIIIIICGSCNWCN